MDYFEYKYVLVGFLMLFYIVYSLIIISKNYVLKNKSKEIAKIPLTKDTLQSIILIILTYIVTIPVLTFYFAKGLRLFYCHFVVRKDNYLIRQGFFSDDYEERSILSICMVFYLFLIVKLIVSYVTRYTIRKDNFIVITLFTLLFVIESIGKGYDIRTYSYFLVITLFLLSIYLIIRNKLSKDF
jgi:hypothetical protein